MMYLSNVLFMVSGGYSRMWGERDDARDDHSGKYLVSREPGISR